MHFEEFIVIKNGAEEYKDEWFFLKTPKNLKLIGNLIQSYLASILKILFIHVFYFKIDLR